MTILIHTAPATKGAPIPPAEWFPDLPAAMKAVRHREVWGELRREDGTVLAHVMPHRRQWHVFRTNLMRYN